MTEELPPLVFLDMAAKAVDYLDWEWVKAYTISNAAINSVVAHARTLERLAKHEPDIVPVDEDEAAIARIIHAWTYASDAGVDANYKALLKRWPDSTPAALAQFKAELAGRK